MRGRTQTPGTLARSIGCTMPSVLVPSKITLAHRDSVPFRVTRRPLARSTGRDRVLSWAVSIRGEAGPRAAAVAICGRGQPWVLPGRRHGREVPREPQNSLSLLRAVDMPQPPGPSRFGRRENCRAWGLNRTRAGTYFTDHISGQCFSG